MFPSRKILTHSNPLGTTDTISLTRVTSQQVVHGTLDYCTESKLVEVGSYMGHPLLML